MRFNDTRNGDLQLRSFLFSGFSTSAFGRAREQDIQKLPSNCCVAGIRYAGEILGKEKGAGCAGIKSD